jgi:hypothetical protein
MGGAATAGRISELTPLGLSPDVPGSMRSTGSEITIAPRLARDYDGVDFRLRTPLDANLVLEFTARS